MLGDIHIKLPESVPRPAWYLLLLVLAVLGLLTFPDIREALRRHLFSSAEVGTASVKPMFPAGCRPLSIQLHLEAPPPRAGLQFGKTTKKQILDCNPERLRLTGASTVADVLTSVVYPDDTIVIVNMTQGIAIVGIPADTRDGYVEVMRCNPLQLYYGSWFSIIPATLHLIEQPLVDKTEIASRTAVCRQQTR